MDTSLRDTSCGLSSNVHIISDQQKKGSRTKDGPKRRKADPNHTIGTIASGLLASKVTAKGEIKKDKSRIPTVCASAVAKYSSHFITCQEIMNLNNFNHVY